MSQFGWDDCPADVKEQMRLLIRGFRRLAGDNLMGVYLHGSLATGCFNPLRSDIDLLAVTRQKMSVKTKRGLARLLLDVSKKRAPVEISFLTFGDLHPWRHPTPYDFHYSEDWREHFERELESGEWESRSAGAELLDGDLAGHITVVRHRGRCLYGKPVAEVFPAVPVEDFASSILADVLSAKFGLLGGGAEQYPVYVVLNACRTLAFLQTGRVLSKEEGGRWALESLPARFHRTIAAALDEYRTGANDRSNLPKKGLAEFSAYIKNKIEQAKT